MGVATIIGLIAVVVWILSEMTKKPDPNSRVLIQASTDVAQLIDLEALPNKSFLPEQGRYVVQTFRQSGNPHQDDRYFESASQAIAAAMSTFRRSKIDMVYVHESNENVFSFRRPFHDHRGRQEGKKVGWIDIRKAA